MITDLSSTRTLGAFPISIGTSIALEYLCGVKSEANPEPKPKVLGNYREFWINVRTLYRNLFGSLTRDAAKEILDGELSDALFHEMEVIVSVVNEYTLGVTKVVFYLSNYSDIPIKYKMASLRSDTTELQKMHTALMQNTIKALLKKGKPEGCEFLTFESRIKPTGQANTLILTHIAYDLVTYRKFGSLTLVESHTGALKQRDMWYTKYYHGKELPTLPFLDGLLPVFGDNEFFRPLNKEARAEILELAKKYHWTPVTTAELVKYSLERAKNPFLKTVVNTFFH